jgi:hypothetical protein
MRRWASKRASGLNLVSAYEPGLAVTDRLQRIMGHLRAKAWAMTMPKGSRHWMGSSIAVAPQVDPQASTPHKRALAAHPCQALNWDRRVRFKLGCDRDSFGAYGNARTTTEYIAAPRKNKKGFPVRLCVADSPKVNG